MKYLRIFESEQIRQQALAQIDYGVLSSAEGVIHLNKASGSGPAPQGNDHYIGTINIPEGVAEGYVRILNWVENCGNYIGWEPLRIKVDNVELDEISHGISIEDLGSGQHTIEIWDDPENEGYRSMMYEGSGAMAGYFDGCGYDSMIIPDYITSIGEYAFNNCTDLTSVNIPNSTTSIGEYAFTHCSSLTSITIPSSVTSIGNSAFYTCYYLNTVHCEGTNPPTIGSGVFYETDQNLRIYVPDESVAAYKTAWPEYADRIVSGNEE